MPYSLLNSFILKEQNFSQEYLLIFKKAKTSFCKDFKDSESEKVYFIFYDRNIVHASIFPGQESSHKKQNY